MKNSSEGFSYPCLDVEKCTQCEACSSACPLSREKGRLPKVACAYASRVESTAARSASGGFVLDLMRDWVVKGGVVVGASDVPYQPDPRFCIVDSVEGCEQLAGSKYVQVDLTPSIHTEIKSLLKDGTPVLFCGTPCQVAAVSPYRKQGNLFLIDIVCQGVPSQKALRLYRKWQEGERGARVVSHSFRSKVKYAGGDYVTEILFENGSQYVAVGEKDLYTRQFQRQIMLRESCYNCPFACEERTGDITVGDYRGSLLSEGAFLKGNVSVAFGNTDFGCDIINRMVSAGEAVSLSVEDAMANNIPLHRPVVRPWARNVSYRMVDVFGFPFAVRTLCLKAYAKRVIRRGAVK